LAFTSVALSETPQGVKAAIPAQSALDFGLCPTFLLSSAFQPTEHNPQPFMSNIFPQPVQRVAQQHELEAPL
jgi:hypothetical protein